MSGKEGSSTAPVQVDGRGHNTRGYWWRKDEARPVDGGGGDRRYLLEEGNLEREWLVQAYLGIQGHNPSPNVVGGQTQANAANVQTNVQVQFQDGKSGIKKRGKPPKINVTRKKSNFTESSSNPVTNIEGHDGFNNTILDHNEASQTSKSVTLNAGATVDKQSISSSFSMF
ncbi:hypothetical protein ACH5RR_001510 [Cinchona calisaya]|uniref:Uncharacterized protein n=1 Tax=Cinchona calisaya TaxID=153742 RepID=A0ABD3B4U8_9GENT